MQFIGGSSKNEIRFNNQLDKITEKIRVYNSQISEIKNYILKEQMTTKIYNITKKYLDTYYYLPIKHSIIESMHSLPYNDEKDMKIEVLMAKQAKADKTRNIFNEFLDERCKSPLCSFGQALENTNNANANANRRASRRASRARRTRRNV